MPGSLLFMDVNFTDLPFSIHISADKWASSFLFQIYGIMPFERLKQRSNIFNYFLMITAPIFYLVCYGLINFGPFGIYQQVSCDSVCRLGNSLLMHLGCFLYLSMHALNLWRRKTFFVVFQQSLDDIDANLKKCEAVGGSKKEVKPKRTRKIVFYVTWLVVIMAFGFSMFYDVKELV